MTKGVKDLWSRAWNCLRVAKANLTIDSDTAASKAYYAAFNGASAYFVLNGKIYRKHSGVLTAYHRDLVNTNLLEVQRGKDYTHLYELRYEGDYGGANHVTEEEAEQAVILAERILRAIHQLAPDDLPMPES